MFKPTLHINQDNYLDFFIDYHEGNLSNEFVDELMEFLELNASLFDEFQSIERAKIRPLQSDKFRFKKDLKLPEIQATGKMNESNYLEWMAAMQEGDLSDEEYQEMLLFLEQNPFLNEELRSFFNLKLQARDDVLEKKESLKKQSKSILLYSRIAVAASIFLLFSFFISRFFFSNEYLDVKMNEIGYSGQYSYHPDLPLPQKKFATQKRALAFTRQVKDRLVEIVSYEKQYSKNRDVVSLPPAISVLAIIQPSMGSLSYTCKSDIRKIENEYVGVFLDMQLANQAAFMENNTRAYRRIMKGKSPEPVFNLWDVAKIAVQSFNRLTNKNYELIKETDEENKIKLLAITEPETEK